MADWDIPGGHFYTQTVEDPTTDEAGFSVTDEGSVAFWRDFVRLAGPANLGYTISKRFEAEENFYQATQASLLQWNVAAAQLEVAPIFLWLHEMDRDDWLEARGIPPAAPELAQDPALPITTRLAWLTHPLLTSAYMSATEAERMGRFGLPMSEPQRFGPYMAQRFDRAVLQLWLDTIPGQPDAGTISLVQVGDLLRAGELMPEPAFLPEMAPTPRPVPEKKPSPSEMRPAVAPGSALSGEHVLVSVGRQWWYAYEAGVLQYDGPVTTGRPELYTPLGRYTIMSRHSPYTFVSPWSRSSPFWYETATSSYAMQITGNGIFLHDAPWRPYNGPGTNVPHVDPDGVWRTGSHGCINMPLAAASWLYRWAPVGTRVDVVQ
ncbi:MAG TPA: L,D-transpeptidase [Chloroflexota bacterium]|nr:L,D-transpeptidase [Chloroflexota bacterium]